MLLANEARRLTRALPPSSPTYRLEHLCGSSVLLLQSMQYSAVAAAYMSLVKAGEALAACATTVIATAGTATLSLPLLSALPMRQARLEVRSSSAALRGTLAEHASHTPLCVKFICVPPRNFRRLWRFIRFRKIGLDV